jgi:16S rRNA processing protein RimM
MSGGHREPGSTGGETAGGGRVSAPPALLEVGHVARAHGLRGEVVVELITNRTERLDPHSVLETDGGPLEVVAARSHGGPDRWVVSFSGVRDRHAAEALRGRVLRAAPIDVDDGTLWVHEVVGAEVVDLDGTPRGRVTDVQANPASDLLVLDTGALVPLRFVADHRPGWLQIDAPPGLFDL